jgi:hypothetical protein
VQTSYIFSIFYVKWVGPFTYDVHVHLPNTQSHAHRVTDVRSIPSRTPAEIPTQLSKYTTPESDSITVRSAEILILCREMTSHHASEVDSVASSPRSDHSFDQHTRVRFMCSFGGKILPRPQDNQLRYVGGDTRIVAVHRSTNFSALLAKLSKLSSGTVLPKPQFFFLLFISNYPKKIIAQVGLLDKVNSAFVLILLHFSLFFLILFTW